MTYSTVEPGKAAPTRKLCGKTNRMITVQANIKSLYMLCKAGDYYMTHNALSLTAF